MALTLLPPKTELPQERSVHEDIRIPVRLPDMFVLFLSEVPAVNPHYATARKESEEWFVKLILSIPSRW